MVPLPPSERESWGAIVGIMVLVLLVVLLLTLLLLYRQRHKRKHNATPTVTFSTRGSAHTEYAVPDVPHSYHQYYSNPSYHTLRDNCSTLPHPPNNHDRALKNTNNLMLGSLKNSQRRALYGLDGSNTLSANWKPHHPINCSGHHSGAFGLDRSYSYSAGAGKYYHKELKESLAVSSSSVNSENPYATIKDLPGPPFCGPPEPPCVPPESSYMEMKSAVPRNRSYTEISRPPPTTPPPREPGYFSHDDPLSHYDLPINSHIPGHYDLPPLRRPPSPRRPPY